ncbi:MAG: permease [bacterium]
MTDNLLEAIRWFAVMTPLLGVLFLFLIFLVTLIQARVPQRRVRGLFERQRAGLGYVGGAVLGTITPFCSMTTIPVLAGLLRSGVPFGPTMAFLVSSPLLDPIVLGVLLFLIGLKPTVIYAGITFLFSMAIARIFTGLGFEADLKAVKEVAGGSLEQAPPQARSWGSGSVISGRPEPAWLQVRPAIARAWRTSWRAFVRIAPHLVLGTAIGATLRGFLPVAWILAVAGPGQPYAIPLMAAVGLPVYINAEILLPITAALLDKGLGVGSVVALVITGLGMSASEVALLTAFFRPRLIAALAVGFFLVAVVGGLLAAVLAG